MSKAPTQNPFLSTDYTSSTVLQALETLHFLCLPPPHLPPLFDPSTSEILRCFHDISAPILSLHAHALLIDSTLSKFFSDVIPRPIDVETRDFLTSPCCSGEVPFDWKRNFSVRSNAKVRNIYRQLGEIRIGATCMESNPNQRPEITEVIRWIEDVHVEGVGGQEARTVQVS